MITILRQWNSLLYKAFWKALPIKSTNAERLMSAEYVDMSNIQVVEDEDSAFIFLKLNHFNCKVEITNSNAAFVVIDNAGIAPESVFFWVSCLASSILWIDYIRF